MTKFLIDENMNQQVVKGVPMSAKGFDIVYPENGGYKGSADDAVRRLANFEQRVLVSQERDFGKFGFKPEDVPHGAIWLRPGRTSQRQTGDLLAGLCRTLVHNFSPNPYDFAKKIVEVHPDHIEVRTPGDVINSYPVPAQASIS